ncbi:MAG: hypothetical protein AB8F34_11665 [Akkermansiaceae bacterium]
MHFKILITLLCLGTLAHADVGPFEREKTDKRTVKSFDGSTTLTVSLERFDRKQLRRVDKGRNKEPEVWAGKRQLPSDLLWRTPTMIKSFSLTIDGKKIHVPERFWNDLPGMYLEKVVINKKIKTEEDKIELWYFSTQQCAGPSITRSANGGTVLISWARPEE